MEAIKDGIDKDEVLNLKALPGISGYIKFGCTIFVDQYFPEYNCMTLIQYATAKRKPKTLEHMIKHARNEEEMTDDQIIYEKSSYTRMSLLKLAVKFGSKGKFYDSVDNTCLEVLLRFFKISDKKYFQDPLIEAIDTNNEDALDLLMKKGADFFSPFAEDENDIEDEYKFFETPIMKLFKKNNDKGKLEHIFDDLLPKNKSEAIIERLEKLNVNGKKVTGLLKDFMNASEFVSGRIGNTSNTEKIIINDGEVEKPIEQNTNENERKCAKCDKPGKFLVDGEWRCDEHQHD